MGEGPTQYQIGPTGKEEHSNRRKEPTPFKLAPIDRIRIYLEKENHFSNT
jgi:hypothetical protein